MYYPKKVLKVNKDVQLVRCFISTAFVKSQTTEILIEAAIFE
jgi:hypothetical protein